MAEAFIGLDMLVTLSVPPGAQLQGKVSSVVAGQSLTLRDVYCRNNGQTITEITIRASDILDLVETKFENAKPTSSAISASTMSTNPPLKPSSVLQPQIMKQFEDPAILSMGKRSVIPSTTTPMSSTPQIRPEAPHISSFSASNKKLANVDIVDSVIKDLASTSLIADIPAIPYLDAQDTNNDAGEHALTARIQSRKRSRKNRTKDTDGRLFNLDQDPIVSVAQETKRGKGWRQTPLLEPNPSFQPFTTLKKKPRGKNHANGWATEDATDVQDMGEFDFETNLSKFDKHSVFQDLRAEDMTADEDRLVGHNRIARPGTNGGKNLHPLENVLGGMKEKSSWNSEADDSEIAIDGRRGSQRDTGSGRNSRRGHSQLRRPASRKDTMIDDHSMLRQSPSVHTGQKGSFYTVANDKRCDTISALQMLNLENIADSEFGLTEDMMSENAGHGIAELAIFVLNDRVRNGLSDQSGKTHNVVVLAGDNKSGLRAVAAGRHLRNHGVNVAVCVLGLSRENDLLVGLRRQLKAFRSFGGKVFDKIQLMEFVKHNTCNLIIDGLLGLTMAFEELGTSDQATAYELIEWSNRCEAEVMAIDIPTGIDPSSGKVGIIDGRPLYIYPAFVVAMGAAKKGLLQSMVQGEGVSGPDAWRIWVADIGIASLAWKKAGTRMRRGMEFDKQWTFEIKFKVGSD